MAKNLFQRSLVVLCLAASSVAHGAIGVGFTRIQGTIVDSEAFGGCMALLETMPSGISCPNKWVTFSCSGDYNSSNMGWKKFENAQLALLTTSRIRVYVDDAQLHNGNCFVRRIDMIP